jgi:hypothetical protein
MRFAIAAALALIAASPPAAQDVRTAVAIADSTPPLGSRR